MNVDSLIMKRGSLQSYTALPIFVRAQHRMLIALRLALKVEHSLKPNFQATQRTHVGGSSRDISCHSSLTPCKVSSGTVRFKDFNALSLQRCPPSSINLFSYNLIRILDQFPNFTLPLPLPTSQKRAPIIIPHQTLMLSRSHLSHNLTFLPHSSCQHQLSHIIRYKILAISICIHITLKIQHQKPRRRII